MKNKYIGLSLSVTVLTASVSFTLFFLKSWSEANGALLSSRAHTSLVLSLSGKVGSDGTNASGSKLSESTVSLLNATNELKQAPDSKKQDSAARLVEYAKSRKDIFLQEIENNPQGVIDNALSQAMISKQPQDIKSYLEEYATITGRFQAVHIDNYDGTSQYEFQLTDEKTGNIYELYFGKNYFPDALTGNKIKINGIKIDNKVAVSTSTASLQMLSSTSNTGPYDTYGSATLGAQKTLVMLVNFTNKSTKPFSDSTIQSVLNTVSNFDLENSYNQTWLTGVINPTAPIDVAGWFTINQSSNTCEAGTLSYLTKQAATAAGFNLSSYTRLVYAFPQNVCYWLGMGTVGGNPSEAWINGTFNQRIVGHEMGHNFGLAHSHSMNCQTGFCGTSEYGDLYDIMGTSTNDFNGYQKERLGWLNFDVSPPVTLVSSDGTYTVAPLESNDAQPKALKIFKSSSIRQYTGTVINNYYYVEYRAGLGFDAGLNSIIVHTGSPLDGNTSYLWDLDQINPATDWILDIGQTYNDEAKGIHITALSADSTGANIDVSFTPVVCTPANPTLVISPTSTSTYSGQSTIFSFNLTNNDSLPCNTSNFKITPSLPAGFTQDPPTLNVSLDPSMSTNGTFILTSSADTSYGSYNITETALNTSISTVSYQSSTPLIMNVLAPDTTPPVVTITSPSNGAIVAKGSIQISGSATDQSGISEIKISVDNNLVKTCSNISSCTLKFTVNGLAAGTHSITVQAKDAGGPVANSASAQITITKK